MEAMSKGEKKRGRSAKYAIQLRASISHQVQGVAAERGRGTQYRVLNPGVDGLEIGLEVWARERPPQTAGDYGLVRRPHMRPRGAEFI